MIRRLLQAALCLVLCPLLAAQQAPATAVNSDATQALPDNPAPNPSDSAGWNRVGDLARGEEITVSTPGDRSLHCLFAGATNQDLFCASPFSERELRFNRADIEKIRMDQSRRNFWTIIGASAIGVGLWSGIGSLKSHDSQTAVADGLAGTAIGALLAFIPAETVKAFHLIPGKLIYRQTK